MANRVVKSGVVSVRRIAQVLPNVALPIDQLALAPSAIIGGPARAAVDGKLEAALKELIKEAMGSSPAVAKLIDGLALDYRSVVARTVRAVIVERVVPELRKQRGLAGLADDVVKRPERRRAPTVAKLLELETPLASHPLFARDARRSRLGEALRITGLGADLIPRLDVGDKAIERWNDLEWEAVVASRTLTAAQRDELRFTADVSRLTGERHGLVEAVRKANARTPADLVTLDRARWFELIRGSGAEVPDGDTPESFAAALDLAVQRTLPAQYFAARIADRTAGERAVAAWRAIGEVATRNPELLARLDPVDVDWTGLDRERLAPAVREVVAAVGTYRHLGAADVLGDAGELARRVSTVERFLANQRDQDLRYVNLLDPDAALDWSGIDTADRTRVRNQVLAYQRVLHLAPDHETATALLRAGLDSSSAIGELSYRSFRARTGLADDVAQPLYRKASHTAALITNSIQLYKDALSPIEVGKVFQGIDPKYVNDLKDIPGYAELFGNTTYCDCVHCRSIFSPAAYFTDLMFFIEQNITNAAFAGKPQHPIRLRTRRPDLWHLKLTCANTDTLIPHLTLVIEILEAYLERTLGIADVPKLLAGARSAIGLPYHVPLATVREYLRDWKLELSQVYALLDVPAQDQHAELLGLADGEWAALVAAPDDTAWIRFPTNDHTRMDVVEFLRFTGLNRAGLGALAASKTAGDFTIVRVPTSNDIQSEKEVVQGLTSDKLDRIGRLLRLARSSGFSLLAVDELIQSPRIAGPAPFDPATLAGIARFKRLGMTLGVPVRTLLGVIDHLPAATLAPLGLPALFHHAEFATAVPDDANVDGKLPALLAITGLGESDLVALFRHCTVAFPFTAHGNVQLTADNVALLYAYATLAKTWRISIADLALVVARRLAAPGNDFRTLDLLEELVGEIAALKSLPVSISEAFALVDVDAERVSLELVTAAVSELQQSGALLDTHFLDLLPNALAAVAGMDVDHTLIGCAFARVGWDGAATLTALNTAIVDGVAAQPGELAPLVALANDLARVGALRDALDLELDDLWAIAQYPALFAIADIRALGVAALGRLQRYRAFRKAAGLTTADAVNLMWQHQVRSNGNQVIAPAALFGAAAAAEVFADAVAAPERAALVPGAAPAFPSQQLVPSPLAADEIALLAERAGLDEPVLRSVLLSIALPANGLAGLTRALVLYRLCDQLGVRAVSLGKLRERDFAGLAATAEWLRSVLEQKYPDQAARDEHITPHTRALNMLRRDALCDYIISREGQLEFHDRNELYAYFLIDVDMGGCFDTSRLVAALSSLQLYVHRCLINLEQAKSDGLSVLPLIDVADIQQEWEWRKNYRVWEANRKVFLYPENYLEPELRDDKTPLFETLEDDLLQREITLDAAEEAYHDYLATFSTLARLKVVAACHDDEHDTTWFVARSHSDPYKYYLRRYDTVTTRWEPWQAIDLGISAPYVSALVHIGRLYLFWVEISSMEKTDFADGNSIFLGIEHQVQLHYSYRESNDKWSADQKLVLIERLRDRAVIDETPPLIKDLTAGLKFASADKTKSREMADTYRASKTYAKVIATEASDTTLTIHYYRECERSKVEFGIANIDDPTNPAMQPVADEKIDAIYLVADQTQGQFFAVGGRRPSLAYYRATLDLLNNEIRDVTSEPLVDAWGGADVPPIDKVAEEFQDDAGVEVIGILAEDEDEPNPQIELMLRNHATTSSPAATDAMLITPNKAGGTVISTPISAGEVHDVLPIQRRDKDSVIQHADHQHWIRYQGGSFSPRRLGIRINTTLDYYLTKTLFIGGIDELLTLATQTMDDVMVPGEVTRLFDSDNATQLEFEHESTTLPFDGSFGDYYKELFFQIPFIIANQLNSQGRYEDAKYWYEKIFNPMAPAPANDDDLGHRVWQYHELRDVKVPMLKHLLTKKATIDVYHRDPFNPHAIARLRLSAYQKAIVMKYVDNLLDWADDLFTQATMESVNEAIMLYVLAAEILGPRPVSVGPCKIADEDQLTYAILGPAIAKGSEFLMYVENVYHLVSVESAVMPVQAIAQPKVSSSLIKTATGEISKLMVRPELPSYTATRAPRATRPSSTNRPSGPTAMVPGRADRPTRPGRPGRRPGVGRHYLPAFCVPPNDMLLACWDRIEDRLFKIRNCLDINGQPLTIPLFQPPLDPMLLVRGKAAGLAIEDVVGQLTEPLPPYRFSYLVDKARQYAATVQTFGGALLSALEKKDGEQLAQLRSTHEQNILKLQRATKQQLIEEARAHLAAVQASERSAQAKVDHYSNLISTGLNPWEVAQQVLKHTAVALKPAEGSLHMLAGMTSLAPDLGSPFAMKWGGTQIGKSLELFAQLARSVAEFHDGMGNAAGIEATYQRRAEEWDQSLRLAIEELTAASKQVKVAEIRLEVAERDLALLDTQLEQAAEVYEFLTTKFSNVDLYTFLSGELMKLYREAYQMASQIARSAERAFQFERDSTEIYIQTDNWQSDRSGLLAGDRLLLQLQRMEKAYLETNLRELEVRQSFSLLQIDPGALQTFQQSGGCQFTIKEAWFDLMYPGQYRRLLKGVRLNIPCVVGPYVNVAAKLQLLASQVRRVPDPDASQLLAVPLTMTRTIATSSAQNDGGAFELNFRDERYLPFEGAGAVNTTWSVVLPSILRAFDYASIADVIITLEYSARYDGVLAQAVETDLLDELEASGLSRLVSLRHEFPDAFYQLTNPPPGQTPSTSFKLEAKHFPVWLAGQGLQIAPPIAVWPQAKAGQTIAAAALGLQLAGATVGSWSPDDAGSSRGTAAIAGSPIRDYSVTATAIDKAALADLVLLVPYSVT